MSKDAIICGVGAALGLYLLSFVEDNVLSSVDKIGCVATPLAATAAMIFSSRSAADPKAIVGGYVTAGAVSFLLSQVDLPMGKYLAVALTVVLQAVLEMEHAPAVIVAFTTAEENTQPVDVISPAAVGAAVLIGIHHVFLVVREKAKID